jgi:hypothetical protein
MYHNTKKLVHLKMRKRQRNVRESEKQFPGEDCQINF